MDYLSILPLPLAQTAPGLDPAEASQLSLRRWFSTISLSAPETAPSLHPLVAWLLGLAALLVLAVLLQGPGRALGQFLGLAGHIRVFGEAMRRFRRAWRPLALLLGNAVFTWTISQFLSYAQEDRLEDLKIFVRAKTVGETAFLQGTLTALTPLRDVCALGDSLLLLSLVTVIVFKMSADRWGENEDIRYLDRPPLPPWTTLCWGGTWLYAMYRFARLVIDTNEMPLGGCLYIDTVAIPLLMLLADGVLLAWTLVELRDAGLGDGVGDVSDIRGALRLVPAAMLACFCALPARYVATGTWLLLSQAPGLATNGIVGSLVRGWGLVDLQAMALPVMGLVGMVAWGSGRPGEAIRGYVELLRSEGGRVAAVLLHAGVACGVLVSLAYAAVLSLPRQPWVLMAADSYAHYATLPIGLLTLAALMSLGGRVLPEATPIDDALLEAGTAVADISLGVDAEILR